MKDPFRSDPITTQKCFPKFRIFIKVIHFAAITHVDESYSDRVGTIQENVIATTTLLEAINTHGQIKRFVHISTGRTNKNSLVIFQIFR